MKNTFIQLCRAAFPPLREFKQAILFVTAVMASLVCVGWMLAAHAESNFRDLGAVNPERHILLEQNWNEHDRQWFYHIDQGSRLLPYAFLLHLEQADSPELFREPLNMLGYGFVPGKRSDYNPDGLPVGFARNRNYAGLTCSACHTQLIKHQGHFLRIDGGQAMLDFAGFIVDLEHSMEVTLDSPGKFQRFARRILGFNANAESIATLRKSLQNEHLRHRKLNARNASQVPYGHGRLDAFGAILNKGLLLTGVEGSNYNPADAPTSYPYLWDTPQHDYVEWNGSQSNSSIGALARNVGEAIGVYGSVQVERSAKRLLLFDAGYDSSIQMRNLRMAEKKIALLQSPLWPKEFPIIDTQLAEHGRRLYETYCLSCHQDIDRADPQRRIQVRMISLNKIGTDPQMAVNTIELKGETGRFFGKPRFYREGSIMDKEVPALHIVNHIMVGVLINNPLQSYLAARESRAMGHSKEIHPPKYLDGQILPKGEEVSDRALLAYKSRPLNGVWSSAPFMHNGSVPTLYDLLLPVEDRPKVFYISSWEYDPVKVGYISEYDGTEEGLFDTRLSGNSNAGHEYGTGYDGLPALVEEDRWALVEYMKSL
ncbi:MAG: di-heme-cytochrome C peroxidase [Candidatus Eutrophobiaceae bacterium]